MQQYSDLSPKVVGGRDEPSIREARHQRGRLNKTGRPGAVTVRRSPRKRKKGAGKEKIVQSEGDEGHRRRRNPAAEPQP